MTETAALFDDSDLAPQTSAIFPLEVADPQPPADGSCGLENRANNTPAGGTTNLAEAASPSATASTAPPDQDRGLENRDGTARPGGAPHVIGIDPSLTGTGVASSEGWCAHRGYKDVTTMPRPRRLTVMLQLVDEVLELIGSPDLVVMEGPAFSRTAGGAHERSYLWWRLYESITSRTVPVAVMTANQRMLYATGKGSASKGAVIDAVARRFPVYDTSGNDNRADAVVMMAAGRDAYGHPLAVLPAAHRRALEAVEWPGLGGAS